MTDKFRHKSHEMALKSSLFKGRPDLYFCYLKTEKLAHAVAFLLTHEQHEEGHVSDALMRASVALPTLIVRLAADEYEEESMLADLYEAISLVRMSAAYHLFSDDNANVLVSEYEGVVERIALGKQVSPFLSLEDFAVPPFGGERALPTSAPHHPQPVKDIQGHIVAHKGHTAHASAVSQQRPPRERATAILNVVLDKKRVSIKDITKIVRGCSEKTVQRELNDLIKQGLVRKEGERRWSVYVPSK